MWRGIQSLPGLEQMTLCLVLVGVSGILNFLFKLKTPTFQESNPPCSGPSQLLTHENQLNLARESWHATVSISKAHRNFIGLFKETAWVGSPITWCKWLYDGDEKEGASRGRSYKIA